MQYRLNFLMDVGFGLLFQSLGFVFVWIVVGQFDAIGGWSLGEITLLYGLRLAAHGIWLLLFSQLYSIDRQVQQGEYDRMLLRPIPALLQLMFGRFRVTVLGDLLGGSVLLGIGLVAVDIDWSVPKVLFLLATLFGGAALDGTFQLGPAALTFRYLDSMPLRVIFDSMFMYFGGYPVTIFDRPARFLITYLVPLAFMAWVPATILLDKTSDLPFPVWIAWCSPAIGAGLLAIAVRIFLKESRHYQSAGS